VSTGEKVFVEVHGDEVAETRVAVPVDPAPKQVLEGPEEFVSSLGRW
jgi:hypothetical protein